MGGDEAMTDNTLSFRAVPGPGFTAGCLVSTWFRRESYGAPAVAYALIGHMPPRRPNETPETVEAGLLGMVDAMRLRPAAERVPHVGDRLIIRGPYVVLDYGHPEYTLRLPTPGAEWRTHVTAGGQVCVTISLDPLPPGAGPDAVEAHLGRAIAAGRAYMGATTLRAR
jgi:hypothetical protein